MRYNRFQGTITLHSTYPAGWNDFLSKSGIEDTITNKLLFESLFYLYGDNYTIDDTENYLSSRLLFLISNGATKYDNLESVWQDMTNKLLLSFEDTLSDSHQDNRLYDTGDAILDGTENFDNYLDQRDDNLIDESKSIIKNTDAINNFKKLLNQITPLESIVNDIVKKIFILV